MNFLTRLIGVAVTGALAWNAHARIQCPSPLQTSPPSLVLIEDPRLLETMSDEKVQYVDWSQRMQQNWLEVRDPLPSDAFIYTSTVMNFLEMASLVGWTNASEGSTQNMMATRLGLFFVQINQSRNLGAVWLEQVQQHVPQARQKAFLGYQPSYMILDSLPTMENKEEYLMQLAELLVLTGQQLHKMSGYERNVPFSSIISITMNPRSQNTSWQSLLYHLVKWQFALSNDHLESLFCEAWALDVSQLVIKIPPTPLLDFYIIEFDVWGRRTGTSVTFRL